MFIAMMTTSNGLSSLNKGQSGLDSTHLEEDAAVTVVAVTVADARGSANMKWKLTKESMSTPSTMHPASSSNI